MCWGVVEAGREADDPRWLMRACTSGWTVSIYRQRDDYEDTKRRLWLEVKNSVWILKF